MQATISKDTPKARQHLALSTILLGAAAPLYVTLLFFRFFIENEEISNYIAITTIISGIIYLIALFVKKRADGRIRIVVAAALFFGSISLLIGKNFLPEVLPQFLAHLGFAWAASSAILPKKIYSSLLTALLLFFTYYVISGIDPESIFTISRNFVSILIIIALSLYYFSCAQEGTKPSLALLLCAMLALLWGVGRAGILSGLIIIAGTTFLSGRRFLPSIIIITILASMIFSNYSGLQNANAFTYGLARFEFLSGQSQRSFINEEYLTYATSSLSDFFLGVPIDTVRSIQEVNGNPHNSYISLHINFGLFGFLSFIYAVATSSRLLIDGKQYLILIILITALFRSAFDSAAFHGPLDIIIFYCIFMSQRERPSLHQLPQGRWAAIEKDSPSSIRA